MAEESLETYFNAEEIVGASKFIDIFHGKLLVSGELSRSDAVLLGVYMMSNSIKNSEVPKDDAIKFTIRLGISATDFSKGLYELKNGKLISESDGKLGLTFNGLKKARQMLAPTRAREPASDLERSGEAKDVPSIGTPSSAKKAIMSLLSSDWGKKPRAMREIADALEMNALYYPSGTLAGVLNYMTKTGTLRRMKSGGTFEYVLKKK